MPPVCTVPNHARRDVTHKISSFFSLPMTWCDAQRSIILRIAYFSPVVSSVSNRVLGVLCQSPARAWQRCVAKRKSPLHGFNDVWCAASDLCLFAAGCHTQQEQDQLKQALECWHMVKVNISVLNLSQHRTTWQQGTMHTVAIHGQNRITSKQQGLARQGVANAVSKILTYLFGIVAFIRATLQWRPHAAPKACCNCRIPQGAQRL